MGNNQDKRTTGGRWVGGGKGGGATVLGLTHSHCVLPMSPVSSVPAADASCEGTSITYHCRMPACVDVMHPMLSFGHLRSGSSQNKQLWWQMPLIVNIDAVSTRWQQSHDCQGLFADVVQRSTCIRTGGYACWKYLSIVANVSLRQSSPEPRPRMPNRAVGRRIRATMQLTSTMTA